MSVVIKAVRLGVYQPGRGWLKGQVFALVDGQRTRLAGSMWRCSCTEDRPATCHHVAELAAFIDPDVINAIREHKHEYKATPPRKRQRPPRADHVHPASLSRQ